MERESMVGLAKWDGGGRGVVKGWHLGGGSILCRGRVGGC